MANKDELKGLFLSLRARLARAASRFVPPHEVEDVVQEAYVRLCQYPDPGKVKHPRSFLLQTVRNLALDHLKRSETRLSIQWSEEIESETRSDYSDVYSQVASAEEFRLFCEAVRELPVQARRVFVLKKVYGYSQREIASQLGISESTVEKHIGLAIRRSAQFMEAKGWKSHFTMRREKLNEK